MKFFQNLVWVAIFSLSGTVAAQTPVYLDETKPMEDRIEDALSRMTLEEKVALCHAQSKFSSPGVPRLGLPENWMTWSSCRGHLGRMGPSRVDERFLYGIPGIDLFGSDLES